MKINSVSRGLSAVIATFVLSATAMLAGAADSDWTESFKEAQAAAKSSGKPILVNFTGSDWCPWCIKLEKEIFASDDFKKWASANVVLMTADFPHKHQAADLKQQNSALAAKFTITGYPTVVFMDAEETELGRSGYLEGGVEHWIQSAEKSLSKHPKPPVADTVNESATLADGLERAQQMDCPLLLVVTPATNATAKKATETLFADKAFIKLACSRLAVAWLKELPAKGSDEEKALADFKKQHKLANMNTFAAVLDLKQDRPLYQAMILPKAPVAVTAVEKALPKTAYNGGWLEDLKTAQAIAAARKRPILLNFTSGPASSLCVKLDSQIFNTDDFRKYARQNLVLVKLDFTKLQPLPKDIQKQNDDLARKYEADKFPTIVLLDTNAKQVGKLTYELDGPAPYIEKVKKLVYGEKNGEK
jgi:thioredoxin-related protein